MSKKFLIDIIEVKCQAHYSLCYIVFDFFLFYFIDIDHIIMKDTEICSILNSMTDDQAEFSDLGGDSDADDYLPINVSTTEKTTRYQNSSFSGNSSTTDLNLSTNTVESLPKPSTSSSISVNRSLWPIRAKRALIDLFNNSSSSEIDNTDKDPDACFSPLVPVPDFSSSSSDDDTSENQQNSNIFKWTKNGQIPSNSSTFKFNEKFGLNVDVDNLMIFFKFGSW